MKVIIKTVEIPVYVSNDGKEFKHKETCLYHEEKMASMERIKWRDKIFKDLENFFVSCDSKGYNVITLCDKIMLINNLLFYQNAEERRTTIINVKTGRTGKAICHNNDKFNRRMGWAIAWARYKGDEIPDYI
jgi:hypothetical protein